jgi:hypothetical protein
MKALLQAGDSLRYGDPLTDPSRLFVEGGSRLTAVMQDVRVLEVAEHTFVPAASGPALALSLQHQVPLDGVKAVALDVSDRPAVILVRSGVSCASAHCGCSLALAAPRSCRTTVATGGAVHGA